MKSILASLILFLFAFSLGAKDEIPEMERNGLVREVVQMMEAFNRGDAKALIEKTHPSIYKLSGGKKNFDRALLAAATKIVELGIEIESSKIEPPGRHYPTESGTICFLPKTTVMVIGEQRIKSVSFMIAIKGVDGEWKYLDGAGMRRNPDQLWKFFPDLPKDIEFPENTVTPIKEPEVEDGADQSATASESKSEGNGKPKLESEGRSQ